MNVLKIDDAKQCGDIFLFRFQCPFCEELNFQSKPQECTECDESYEDFLVDVSNLTFHLVCGTKRKGLSQKKKLKAQLMGLQESVCAYCFTHLEGDEQIEHVVPVSCGGSNDMSNLCMACPECNLLAHSFYFTDFYAKQNYILKQKAKRRKNKTRASS